MKVININLHIYGIPVKGTLTIEEKDTFKPQQDSLFTEMKRADGYETEALLNHETRQVVARGLKERLCKIEGCFKKIYTKSLCSKHYQREYKLRRGGVENGNDTSRL